MLKVTIRLVKSPIGHQPNCRTSVKALGLGKIGSTVTRNAVPTILGLVKRVQHLVQVNTFEESNDVSTQSN